MDKAQPPSTIDCPWPMVGGWDNTNLGPEKDRRESNFLRLGNWHFLTHEVAAIPLPKLLVFVRKESM